MLASRESHTLGNVGTESFRSKGTGPYDSGVARQQGCVLRRIGGSVHCSCRPESMISSKSSVPPGANLGGS